MRHFQLMAMNVDTVPLLNAILRQPHLWNAENLRTTFEHSPHTDASDILIRFNDIEHFRANPEAIMDEHESIWHPAAHMLPMIRPIIFDLMRRVEAERVGRVMITRLPPGGTIKPHVDGGSHASYYDRYHVMLQNSPGSNFYCGDEECYMAPGSVWWFDNGVEHSVVNNGLCDRITLIIDVRTLR